MAAGKTVNVKLSPEAASLYKAASQQYRKLKSLLNRLERLSQNSLRRQANVAKAGPATGRKTGDMIISPPLPRPPTRRFNLTCSF
jgi:hypothetical protein